MSSIFSRISTQLVDSDGGVASTPLYLQVDDAQTIAQAVAEAQALASLIDPLVGPAVQGVQLVLTIPRPGGIKAGPVAGSTTVAGAAIAFRNASSRHVWDAGLPGIARSKVAGGKLIVSDTQVQALINHLVGSTSPYMYCTDNGGGLTAVDHTFLRARKHTPVQEAGSRTLG